MKRSSVLVGSCAVALLATGCTTGSDGDLNPRNGTSGYGTGTGGGPDLGDGWGEPDFGDGGPDLGGGDLGGGSAPELPEIEEFCQVFGQAEGDDPVEPFKTPGGMWAQGSTKGCGYYALLNGNIAIGADDTDGAFNAKLLACLAAKGVTEEDIHDGVSVAEMGKVALCKADEMKKAGTPVTFSVHGFTGNKKFLDRCQEISDALAGGGSAILGFVDPAKPGDGHIVRITNIVCDPENDVATVTFSDPNNPAAGTFTVTIDCDNLVTGGAPAHPWIKVGTKPIMTFIEKKDEEEDDDE